MAQEIAYVVAENPDDRLISRAADILRSGGLVAYPTDSSWSIGCSSESKKGLERLRKLRGEKNKHPFTLICDDIARMSTVAVIPNPHYRFIKHYVPGPTVFILRALMKIEKVIGMKRKEVGVRVPDHNVPRALVQALDAPVFSLTASRNLEADRWWDNSEAPDLLYEGGWELDEIPGIDLILDSGETLAHELSSVVDLTGDSPEVLREGKSSILL